MTNNKKIEWILRIGVAGEFLGHGVLAVGGKEDWITWIERLSGLDTATATTFIMVVGAVDILLALLVLVKPIKPVLLWMTFWGFWTALVRPLVHWPIFDTPENLVSIWGFVERFANWAAPLALFFLLKNRGESNNNN
ncbi:MAG: hypothetical protein COU27_00920 [Candidatus Levybacteria bacterium CG10_big_fil_rev_8_21_14_0_10_36_7]|nr:MAG: hypothetical protein COU27_00920 [Candidatus Levybacteria bacterium CG10_big_fil_rev_8_21_14_0_10_36_7]